MKISALILTLLFAGAAHAQIVEAVRRPPSRVYKVELLSLALAESFDYATTAAKIGTFRSVCSAPGTCTGYVLYETNPILGRNPSNARIAAYGAGEMVLFAITLHYTERSRFRAVRWTARALTAATIANHIHGGTHNLEF